MRVRSNTVKDRQRPSDTDMCGHEYGRFGFSHHRREFSPIKRCPQHWPLASDMVHYGSGRYELGEVRRQEESGYMAKHQLEHSTAQHKGGRATGAVRKSRAVAMREMDLTPEEARELRERIERPVALPKRQPRDLPPADPSLLH